MNEIQQDICLSLIEEANTKAEVVVAMTEMFKDLNKKEVSEFVKKSWPNRPPKNMVSIRNVSYKGRVNILQGLLAKKERGEISSIRICLNKCLSKKTPYEMYVSIIGKEYFYAPGREVLRGRKVELIGMNQSRTHIIVKDCMGEYRFSPFDINAANYIEAK